MSLPRPIVAPSTISSAVASASADAIADPAQANGTTVNSTYLQGLLDTPGVARVRIPKGAATWVLNTPLVMSSGQTLDARGASFTYPAGTAGQFLTNDARLTALATTRDTNITILGGTYNRPPNITSSNLDTMNIMFAFVDGLEVSGVRVTSTGDQRYATTSQAYGGKYAVYLYNCNQSEIHHCTFAICSDGVHATGATRDLHVHHISGTTGDDAVAIMPRDNPAWEIAGQGFGDLDQILIENIYNTTPNNGVKVLVGKSNDGLTKYNARRIVIRSVDGSHASAVWIGGDTNYSYLSGGVVQNVTISDITERASGSPAVRFYHDSTCLVRGVKITRTVSLSGPAVSILDCPIDDITVADTAFDTGSSSVPMILLAATAVVNRLTIRDCRVRYTGTAPGSSPLVVPSGATLTNLYVDGLETSGTAWSIGDLSSVTNVVAHKVRSTDQSGYVRTGSPGALTIRAAEIQTAGTDANRIDPGSTITPLSTGWRGDVTVHRPAPFASLFNTNGSASCGVGPAIYDGSNWKNTITGALFTAAPTQRPASFPTLATAPSSWLRADQITGVANGAGVSSWPAAAGSAAALPTGSTAPVLFTGHTNGQPAVRFNSTATTDHLFLPATHLVESLTVFAVYNCPTVGTAGQIVAWSTTDQQTRANYGLHMNIDSTHGQRTLLVSTGSNEADAPAPASGATAIGSFQVGPSTAHTMMSILNGGTINTKASSGAYTATSMAGFGLAGTNQSASGTAVTGGIVDLLEFIVVPAALSAADIHSVNTYLGLTYNVAVGAN